MTDRPWMPFWVNDYLGKTMHLNLKEHGAYLLLICHYWMHGSLPQDDGAMREICKASPWEWSKIKAKLQPFFEMPDWRHNKIEEELVKHYRKRHFRQIAGRKGAYKTNAKWLQIGQQMPRQTTSKRPSIAAADAAPVIKKDRKKEETEKEPERINGPIATNELMTTMRDKGWV